MKYSQREPLKVNDSHSSARWILAVCSTALCIGACSSDDGPAVDAGSPVSTAGTGAGGAGTGVAQAGATAPKPTGASGTTGAAGARSPARGAAAGAPAVDAGAATAGAPAPSAGTTGASGAPATATAGTGGTATAGTGGTATPPAVACDPADKGPEPTPASFTQIMGYTDLSEPPTTGPNKPVLEVDGGLPEWTVYRPETLAAETLHPVLAWGNGGCLRNGTLYGPWLLELASHGYIVLADGPPTEANSDPVGAGMRTDSDGSILVGAIDWLIAENERPCSMYYHKVAVDKLAVAGQSCGGLMALASAGDERITTAIIGNSGLFADDDTIYSALHSPIAYLIGGSSDVAYENAERDFMNINNVPLFYGNMDVGHGGTWNSANGGEFGRVGKAWLDWHLKGDMAASKLFVGADCELCGAGSMWDVQKKMID